MEGEGEGVQKLVDYLNATRRQAELSINILNEKIDVLSKEKKALEEQLTTERNEKILLRRQLDDLKKENYNKSRLQERDEWKALVDSITRDRARLQEECVKLEIQLEDARNQSPKLSSPTNSQATPDSPSSAVRRLRSELDEALYQIEVMKQQSSQDKRSHIEEAKALQDELNYYKKNGQTIPKFRRNTTPVTFGESSKICSNPPRTVSVHVSKGSIWLNPLDAMVSFVFPHKIKLGFESGRVINV